MTKKGFFSFAAQCIFFMLIAYATISLINHWFLKKEGDASAIEIQRGQSFTAPAITQVSHPINREIDFVDSKRPRKEQLTEVKTGWGAVTFSSDGATLHRFEVNRALDGRASSITTVFPLPIDEREARCFLVAFDRPTPYFYQLKEREDTDQTVTVTYKASFDRGNIEKTFTVHKNTYQIDVALRVDTPRDDAVQVRLLFPAPEMIDLHDKDTITGFALEEKKIKRFDHKVVPMDRFWKAPALFGASNRYFVNALVADKQGMIDRAYFCKTPAEQLLCCIESHKMVDTEDIAWSFYFGPKEMDDVGAVDPRLEELVDYSGWFGSISMLMLKLLKYLNDRFHNFGIAIILLTLLMRLIMLPFTLSGEKQRKQRADLDKKLKYLQQKYKDNPERFNNEKYELIRKHGLGGVGCIVPLLQAPFFLGLNRLLSTSIELYKAPFITGWISDLSAPDPYYILPMLFALGMILTALQMPKDQRSMFFVIGIGGAGLFSSFAAGLVLFFVVSMFAGIISTFIANKLKLS